MGFLRNIFTKKEEPIRDYNDFWSWFKKNGSAFFNVVKNGNDIEKSFFDRLSPKLSELKDGYFYLTGMYDDNTAELILTADGDAKNIVFIEELVEQAPKLDGWKFTSLKPESDIENAEISMAGYKFYSDNMFFYPNDYDLYPDEIDISVIHNDLTEENRESIVSGVYIFLDNYLGELDFVNNIDSIKIIGVHQVQKELIPIKNLKSYLNWRQKEFIEKYEGIHYSTDSDEYSLLEAELKSGNKMIAVVNTQLIDWDCKASHPWISVITFKYDGSNNNGMPQEDDYNILNEIEENLQKELLAIGGYLHIVRQTANNERDIYFACKDFRLPSKVFFATQKNYCDKFEISYDIYKDKYWQSFDRFR